MLAPARGDKRRSTIDDSTSATARSGDPRLMTSPAKAATHDGPANAGTGASDSALPDVFIAFATANRDRARLVKTRLEEKYGYRVWWHEDIQCGSEWHSELDRVVGEAACIVVLWSAESLRSDWVRHEASQAIALRRYVPAKIAAIEIPRPFDPIQAADLSDWSGQPDHPGLVSLAQQIGKTVPRPRWRRFRHKVGLSRGTVVVAAVATLALAGLAWLVTTTAQVNREQRGLLRRQEAGVAELQRQLERSMQPLGDVKATLRLRVGTTSPALRQYSEFIRGTLATAADIERAMASGQVNFMLGFDDVPSVVSINPYGPLHPLHVRATAAWPLSEAALRTVFRWVTTRFDVQPRGTAPSPNTSTAVNGVGWHVTVDSEEIDGRRLPVMPTTLMYNIDYKCLYLDVQLKLAADVGYRGSASMSVSDVVGGMVSVGIDDMMSDRGLTDSEVAAVGTARDDLAPDVVVFSIGGRLFRSFLEPRGRETAGLSPRFDGEVIDVTRAYQPGMTGWETLLLDREFTIP